MVFRFGDYAKESSTTVGTGAIRLSGAAVGAYQTIDSVLADGEQSIFVVTDGADKEVFVGTFSVGSPQTVSRDVLLESTTGSFIDWVLGTKDIWIERDARWLNPFRILTAAATLDGRDRVAFCDASGGDFNVTLPSAADLPGKEFLLMNTGASGTPTLVPDGAETIDGASTLAVTTAARIYSDGSNWFTASTGGGGVTDHGALTGLGDDDHTQYALADGTRWTDTQTASRAVVSDASGNLVVSSVTTTELGYLSGVTSAIQTQIDGKASSGSVVTDHGALTGLGDDDHTQYALADGTRWTDTQTASRAVVSDGSGNLVVSSVTTTELGYLSGVTSAIQTQIDDANGDITTLSGMIVTDHGGLTGLGDDDHTQYALADGTRWTDTQTASRAVVSDGSGNLVVSSVTSTELGYLSGVTSAIQTQLDGKADALDALSDVTITSASDGDELVYDSTAAAWVNQTKPGDFNMLDNGRFDWWQLGLGNTLSDAAYNGPDRWYSLIQSGSHDFRLTTGAYVRVRALSAARSGIAQIVESPTVYPVKGKPVRAQCQVSTGSGTATVRIALLAWTTVADVVTKDIVNDWTSGTFTTGNFFASTGLSLIDTRTIEATTTAQDLACWGTVPTTAFNLIVFIWRDEASTGSINIRHCGLYAGVLPREFLYNAADDEARVKRFLRTSYDNKVAPGTATTTGRIVMTSLNSADFYFAGVAFGSSMRATPTCTAYAPTTGTSGKVYDLSIAAEKTGSFSAGQNGGFFGGSGMAAGHLFEGHFKADAQL